MGRVGPRAPRRLLRRDGIIGAEFVGGGRVDVLAHGLATSRVVTDLDTDAGVHDEDGEEGNNNAQDVVYGTNDLIAKNISGIDFMSCIFKK